MSGMRRGNDTAGPASSYDPTVVGVTFYTDDPETPIAGFGERERLPIPDVGEVVRINEERLESGGDPVAPAESNVDTASSTGSSSIDGSSTTASPERIGVRWSCSSTSRSSRSERAG